MFSTRILWAALVAAMLATTGAAAQTKIVGSSTVSPFAQIAKRRVEERGASLTIETTGTSGGFSLFCNGGDADFAPVALASRPIKASERARCAENGAGEILEYELGLSGVVIAAKKTRAPLALTRQDLFLALAARTPASGTDCRLVDNPRKSWRDVRPGLPNMPIEVYGPPTTSGTRASFIDLALVAGAQANSCMQELRARDPGAFMKAATTLRVDGAWIDAGENDSVIIAAVTRMPHTLGVIGYPQFARDAARLSASPIDGIAPTRESIGAETYPLSRTLRVYAKKDALAANPHALAFLDELTGPDAIGPDGYLFAEGLIPLNQAP